MRQLNSVASNDVMVSIPFAPFLMASQTVSVPMPTEVTRPTPVTTTLRCKRDSSGLPGKLLLLGFDVIDGVLDGANLLGIFVGDIEVERFLERHHQFNDV